MNVSEKIPVLAEKNSLTVWAAAPEVLECQPKRIPGFQAGILWRIWSNPGKIYWRNLRKITAWTTGNNDVEKPVNITERNQGKKFMGNINNNSCRNLKKKTLNKSLEKSCEDVQDKLKKNSERHPTSTTGRNLPKWNPEESAKNI